MLKGLWKKYKEMILYVFFGGLTTLVNILVYFVMARMIGIHYAISTTAAWVLSVAFAYVTNRLFVFESKAAGLWPVAKEALLFFGFRLLSYFVDLGIMILLIDHWGVNDMVTKVIANVVVIILNYVFSKLIIFRKK